MQALGSAVCQGHAGHLLAITYCRLVPDLTPPIPPGTLNFLLYNSALSSKLTQNQQRKFVNSKILFYSHVHKATIMHRFSELMYYTACPTQKQLIKKQFKY